MFNFIVLIILLIILVKYIFITAPFVPAHKIDLENLEKIVEKYSIKNLVDLGVGNGRIVNYLAKKFPERKFFGIEISLWLFLICKFRFFKSNNVFVKYGNAYWYDWNEYEAIYVFWMPKHFQKNIKKIRAKLSKGQYIISYAFEIQGLQDKLLEQIKTSDKNLPIYVYRF